MNTFVLRDSNLSGAIVWHEDFPADEQAEFIGGNAGTWTDYMGEGDILLSHEWSLRVYTGTVSKEEIEEGRGNFWAEYRGDSTAQWGYVEV